MVSQRHRKEAGILNRNRQIIKAEILRIPALTEVIRLGNTKPPYRLSEVRARLGAGWLK
jgi:hypothetical protein